MRVVVTATMIGCCWAVPATSGRPLAWRWCGAGLGTGVSCTEFGPGTTGPTWWRYSDIYVR